MTVAEVAPRVLGRAVPVPIAALAAAAGDAVARDIRLAEMLIAARATPDPAVGLKNLLRR